MEVTAAENTLNTQYWFLEKNGDFRVVFLQFLQNVKQTVGFDVRPGETSADGLLQTDAKLNKGRADWEADISSTILLPKRSKPTHPKHFRGIALQQVLHKFTSSCSSRGSATATARGGAGQQDPHENRVEFRTGHRVNPTREGEVYSN